MSKHTLSRLLHSRRRITPRAWVGVLLGLLLLQPISAQNKELKGTPDGEFGERVDSWASEYVRTDVTIKPSKLESLEVSAGGDTVVVTLGGGFPEQHFTPEVVETVYGAIRELLPDTHRRTTLVVKADGRDIRDLVPMALRRESTDRTRLADHPYEGEPWVTNISRPYTADRGLEGRHIALWPSHGRYYKDTKGEWLWQRPRLFCVTEDILAQSVVNTYIIPMLQNAGAVVFTPRERDYQTREVIVDNDTPDHNGAYAETRMGQQRVAWRDTGRRGFAMLKERYTYTDSPFTDGTARCVETTRSRGGTAVAQWTPYIPQTGKYAVYVAYQTDPHSVPDAEYTVYHKGGMTEFRVNQRMGGGTWVYLGTFEFDEGTGDFGRVTLSNHSAHKGVVTADAVRFGGGMGNIAPPYDNAPTSGMPRWAEAAKYTAEWYGFPYSTHTEPFGSDDYSNDIAARSAAINLLSGGTDENPWTEAGWGVPLDLCAAFHTDAGALPNDEFVGSLGVYMTNHNDGLTGPSLDRYVSRDLASMFLANLHTDLGKYGWRVRQLWNRNYGEARSPMVPCCILEMLSHQNFADMRLAHDPHFKFDLARSIYKTIVKYLATLHQREYAIQPLPPGNFAVALNEGRSEATLTWAPTEDPLEPTARPREYIVYTRLGDEGFDNGTLVRGTSHTVKLLPGQVCSFRITALNRGGESFPSETLACGISPRNNGTVLVVNAFTRLEGPKVIDTPTEAGFDIEADPGVPYGLSSGYCGAQTSFDRSKAGRETSDALGASGDELECRMMMGNTFDYPAIHGRAILGSGEHSFTSCGEQALLSGQVRLDDYPIADIIYGTQKAFNTATNALVSDFYERGGRLILSATHEGGPSPEASQRSRRMTSPRDNPPSGESALDITGCGTSFQIPLAINPDRYPVPNPSVLTPQGDAFPILTYPDGSYAGIALPKRLVRLGFPLESITNNDTLDALVKAFLTFLNS